MSQKFRSAPPAANGPTSAANPVQKGSASETEREGLKYEWPENPTMAESLENIFFISHTCNHLPYLLLLLLPSNFTSPEQWTAVIGIFHFYVLGFFCAGSHQEEMTYICCAIKSFWIYLKVSTISCRISPGNATEIIKDANQPDGRHRDVKGGCRDSLNVCIINNSNQ